MRFRPLLLTALLFCLPICGLTQKIAWAPAQLTSGSPCLFTVEFESAPTAVKGEWFGHEVDFFPAADRTRWYALAGADVETPPGSYPLTLQAAMADGKSVSATREIPIGPSHYRQVELHVAENFVSPDAVTLKRIAADKEIKDHAFAQSAPAPLWHGDFRLPLQSPATDSFGTRRLFNGKLASIHRGMDFRAASGTPVHAANAGRVILARSFFYEGNCVVIDHGQQFMTIYMHLSKIQVAEGQIVKARQLLGLSGATGRATGPHLHFAARWQGAYLDPAILFRMKLPAFAAGEANVYFNDFNGQLGAIYPEWSSSGYTNTANTAGTILAGSGPQAITNVDSPNGKQRFLGEFGGPVILAAPPYDPQHFVRVNETVTLTLKSLKPHSQATLSFDLYILKSWDGDNPNFGTDRWSVKVEGGPTLLDTTFSNNFKIARDDLSRQSYPRADSLPQTATTAANSLGYTFFGDSIYHFELPFNHTGQTLILRFSSSLFEGKGLGDESWGLDNVRISTNAESINAR